MKINTSSIFYAFSVTSIICAASYSDAVWTPLTNTQLVLNSDAVIIGQAEEIFVENNQTFARIWVEKVLKGEILEERIALPFHRPGIDDPRLTPEEMPAITYEVGRRYLLLLVSQGPSWDVFLYPKNVVIPLDQADQEVTDMIVNIAKALDTTDPERAQRLMITMLSQGYNTMRLDLLETPLPMYNDKIEQVLLVLARDALVARIRAASIRNIRGNNPEECLTILKEALNDYDLTVQSEVALALSRIPGGKTVLSEKLQTAGPSTVLVILENIDISQDPAVFERLVEILKGSAYRETRALKLLQRADPQGSLRIILDAFRYGSPEVRFEAVQILSDVAYPEVLEAFRTVLYNHEDGYHMVISYLGQNDLKREELLNALQELLKKTDCPEDVIKGIALLNDVPQSSYVLESIYLNQLQYASIVLERIVAQPTMAVREFLRKAYAKENDPWLRSDIVLALAKTGDCAFLNDYFPHGGSSRLRRAFIEGFAEGCSNQGAEILLKELKTTSDYNIQIDLIRALSKLNDYSATKHIIEFITGSFESALQAEACIALGRLPAPEAEQTLWNVATRPGDVALRVAATEALGSYHSYQTVDKLTRQVFHDSSTAVKLAAIRALGRIGGPDAFKALSDFWKYNIVPTARAEIITAIANAEVAESETLLINAALAEENPSTLQAVLISLEKVLANSDQAQTEISQIKAIFLEHFRVTADEQVKAAAAVGLAQFSDDESFATLIEGLDNAVSLELKEAILTSIGSFKSSAALNFLTKVIEDSSTNAQVQTAALNAMAAMSTQEAVDWLFQRYNEEKTLSLKKTIARAFSLIRESTAKMRIKQLIDQESFYSLKQELQASLAQMPLLVD